MKKSELKQLIKEEISNILNTNPAKTTIITDFPYLSKKNPNNKAIRIELSRDQIDISKNINPFFVVVKTFDEYYNKFYYTVYYQPSDSTNKDYWEQGSSTYRQNGKGQLQSQLIRKLINIAIPKLK